MTCDRRPRRRGGFEVSTSCRGHARAARRARFRRFPAVASARPPPALPASLTQLDVSGLSEPRRDPSGRGADRRHPASRASRSRRSCTRPVATSSSPAAARRGLPRRHRRTTTSCGGQQADRLPRHAGRGTGRPGRAPDGQSAELWSWRRPLTLHFRTLRDLGVTLVGRLLGAGDGSFEFADDLAASVAFGDERLQEVHGPRSAARGRARASRCRTIEEPAPFLADRRRNAHAGLAASGSVLYASGFRPAYRNWLSVAGRLRRSMGFPLHRDGAEHRGAGAALRRRPFPAHAQVIELFSASAEDAAVVADAIASA